MKTTENEVFVKDLILSRSSPISFSPDNISEEVLLELFDTARWAASSYNEQPWRFIYASKEDNPEAYGKLYNLLAEANQTWAKTAPVLILVVSKNYFSLNGKSNYFAQYDTGMAVGNLAIHATSMGIALHQMGGYDREKAREDFGLGKDFDPVAVIALGYPAETGKLPESLKGRANKPRVRKPVNEIAFQGVFKA